MNRKQPTLSNYDLLERIAAFLSHAYAICQNYEAVVRLLNTLETDYDRLVAFAIENRVWTNIVACIAESPAIMASCNPRLRKSIAYTHLANQARAIHTKQQMIEIDQIADANNYRLVAMKGITRFFDNTYPSNAHRFLSDIDLYFEDIQIVEHLANIGYQTQADSDIHIHEIDQNYQQENRKGFHHLPPIVKDNHNKAVELHHQLLHLTTYVEMRQECHDTTIPIIGLTKTRQLNRPDQLILLIIHSRFSERLAMNSTSRLRNLLEGYLLYRALNRSEKNTVDNHFHSQCQNKEYDFWLYICQRLFHANYKPQSHSWCAMRYKLHQKLSHSSNFIKLRYLYYNSTRILFFWKLTSQQRIRAWYRLTSTSRWKRIISKLTGM